MTKKGVDDLSSMPKVVTQTLTCGKNATPNKVLEKKAERDLNICNL